MENSRQNIIYFEKDFWIKDLKALQINLEIVRVQTFQNLTFLEELKLSGIKEIEVNSFDTLQSLKSLELKGVEILPEFLFQY